MKITNEEINDLVVCALEGGINYWCSKVEITKEPTKKYEFASDVISIGGVLTLQEEDHNGDKHELTKEKFLKGVEKAIEHYEYEDVEDLFDNHDAETADVIIQFALFNEIVYG